MPPTSDNPQVVRNLTENEADRARQFFPPTSEQPPADARFIATLKLRPVERVVAVMAWWRRGEVVSFLVAHKPGVPAGEAAEALVPELEMLPGIEGSSVEYGRMLRDDEGLAPWLAAHGYLPERTERAFEAPGTAVYERLKKMMARYGNAMPDSWRTESISNHPPEFAWPLIEPYRLIQFDSLKKFWSSPGERGYDPIHSNILCDGDEAIGALLVRTNRVCMAVDVRVVKEIAPRLRSLANLALFAHIWRDVTPTAWRVLAFRADEKEHRETSNLAERMGGHEVAVRHIYARTGRAADGR